MNKTMTITSITILIAAISVATTLTMVQADPDGDTKATFGIPGSLGSPNGFAGGDTIDHLYTDVAKSDAGTVAFTNPASNTPAQGFFDAVEPVAQATAVFPVPDKSIVMFAPGDCFSLNPGMGGFCSPMNIVRGYEEARFTFDSLVPDAIYEITVIIRDMDDFGFTDGLGGTPQPETVFVTGNGVDLGTAVAVVGSGTTQVITKTLPTFAIVDVSGDLTIGFNENFQWDPSIPSLWDSFGFFCTPNKATPGGGAAGTPFCIPSQTGVRVEQIELAQASQSQGFWKNNPTETTALLPKTIGDLDVTTFADATTVFDLKIKGNAHNTLAKQLLAALLNDMNGSICNFPATAATDAQTILDDANYDGTGSTTKPTKTDKTAVNAIKDVLEDYNTNTVC